MNVNIEISKAMARLAIQEINNNWSQLLTPEHADAIVELLKQLEAAHARIAELEAQLAKPAQIHEVIDDFGASVTAVTL